MTLDSATSHMLDVLRQSRAGLERRHGVKLIGLVGSRARGQARAGSDLDILYAPAGNLSLFDLGALWSDLHELTGAPIDLVDRDQVRPAFRRDFERDLVPF